jgi:hypothetical protein
MYRHLDIKVSGENGCKTPHIIRFRMCGSSAARLLFLLCCWVVLRAGLTLEQKREIFDYVGKQDTVVRWQGSSDSCKNMHATKYVVNIQELQTSGKNLRNYRLEWRAHGERIDDKRLSSKWLQCGSVDVDSKREPTIAGSLLPGPFTGC